MADPPRPAARPTPSRPSSMQWEEPQGDGPGMPPETADAMGRLGFTTLTAGGFALAVLLFLVQRLLGTIYENSLIDGNDPGDGLAHAISWIGFAAAALASLSLLWAALTARLAHWGARAVLLVLGLGLLVAQTGGLATLAAFMGNLFGGGGGFPFN